MPADANRNETALPKWISLRALDPYAYVGSTWGRIHRNVLDTQMKWGRDARKIRYGDARRKPKYLRDPADPEGEDLKTAK